MSIVIPSRLADVIQRQYEVRDEGLEAIRNGDIALYRQKATEEAKLAAERRTLSS